MRRLLAAGADIDAQDKTGSTALLYAISTGENLMARLALSDNSKIVLAMMEARDRGDQAEADRLLSTLEGPAHMLMAIKNSPGGADWVREMNLNTRLAG